jgi:hypothetical protein
MLKKIKNHIVILFDLTIHEKLLFQFEEPRTRVCQYNAADMQNLDSIIKKTIAMLVLVLLKYIWMRPWDISRYG